MAAKPTTPASTALPAELPPEAELMVRLNELLEHVMERNPFQRGRLDGSSLRSLGDLPRLPATTKDDLLADQLEHPPFGTNLTYELERYTYIHQTSGTSGATLRVLDTPVDWMWWRRCLGAV